MKKLLPVACLLCMTAAHPAQPVQTVQLTVPFTFGNVGLQLPIPPGYCVIPKDTEAGKPFYDLQENMQSTADNVVAVLFADCNEWEIREQKRSYRIHKTGIYFFQLMDKQEQVLPDNMGRDAFIKMMAKEIQPTMEVVSQSSFNKNLDEALKGKAYKAGRLNGPLVFGVLRQDSNAVYFGAITPLKYPKEDVRLAAVSFSTAVRRMPVVVTMYDDDSGKPGIEHLLKVQTALASSLQKLNP